MICVVRACIVVGSYDIGKAVLGLKCCIKNSAMSRCIEQLAALTKVQTGGVQSLYHNC